MEIPLCGFSSGKRIMTFGWPIHNASILTNEPGLDRHTQDIYCPDDAVLGYLGISRRHRKLNFKMRLRILVGDLNARYGLVTLRCDV
jgi:hypothetical protein